jgi:hypothetical protein
MSSMGTWSEEISRREQRGLRNRSPEKLVQRREGQDSQRSSERPT